MEEIWFKQFLLTDIIRNIEKVYIKKHPVLDSSEPGLSKEKIKSIFSALC